MTRLNPQQREAVHYIDSPLLVLAGAGSGKTSVISRKIAYLVQSCNLRPERVVAVTFTNKAAREMRSRVRDLLPQEQAEALRVSTFHQLGLAIIRAEHKQLGLRPGFSIFDNQDSLTLLQDLLRQEHPGAVEQAAAIMQRISAWKSAGVEPPAAQAQASGAAELLAAAAYARYDETLRAFNAVDFDDLLLLPASLLGRCGETLERWQSRVHYLLVDEYQDTNQVQYRMVQLLVGLRGALTVVGDDDQSIYAWRGAKPENLAQLRSDFPGLKIIALEQNYRSTGRILQAANRLIENNAHLFEKRLWSELGPGEELRVIECADEEAEADQVVTEILDHRMRTAARLGDYAVLYRGNHQSRHLELALQRHQVAYQISGGTSFFARNEIKDVMGYLRLLVNADDDNAFLRVANVPRRGIGAATLSQIGELAARQGGSLLRACAIAEGSALTAASGARLQAFLEMLKETRQSTRQGAGVSALRKLLRRIDYEGWLNKNAASEDVAERRMANVHFLLDSLERIINREAASLEEAIAQLVLRDLMEQQEEEKNAEDSVQLLTLHAAKGLEFNHVYIMGVEENLLPHRNSLDSGDISEERRLAYVGITRARQTLTLLWARSRRQYGERIDCAPSRFLDELPRDDMLWLGGEAASQEDNLARGSATLSGLRALFD